MLVGESVVMDTLTSYQDNIKEDFLDRFLFAMEAGEIAGGDKRGKHTYRFSIRSPMFITIPYASKCMIGYKVADIPAIMGSFDPCIGETDR